MQMRAGGAAGASAETDLLPAGYLLAFFDLEFGEVQIEREQTLSMVEYHTISFKEEGPREQNRPGIESGNRGSDRHGVVQTLVGALGLTIEGAARAEHVGNTGNYRRLELARPFALWIYMLEDICLERLVLIDLLQLVRTRLSELPGHGHGNTGIFRPLHGNLALERQSVPAGRDTFELQWIVPGRGLQADARDSVPGLARRIEEKEYFMSQPAYGQRIESDRGRYPEYDG